jgi:hypothetical protein
MRQISYFLTGVPTNYRANRDILYLIKHCFQDFRRGENNMVNGHMGFDKKKRLPQENQQGLFK